MSTTKIKVVKTDSDFIEKAGTKVSLEGKEFYYMPFWFLKIGEGLYEEMEFEALPQNLINFINNEREKTQQ